MGDSGPHGIRDACMGDHGKIDRRTRKGESQRKSKAVAVGAACWTTVGWAGCVTSERATGRSREGERVRERQSEGWVAARGDGEHGNKTSASIKAPGAG